MNYRNLIGIAITLFIASCGGGSEESKEGLKALETVSDMVSNAGNVAERQSELNDMTPLTQEEFLSWAPESVMGLSKNESSERYLAKDKYGYSGYNVYFKGDEKSIQFEVFDGAGSSIYSQYAGMLSTDGFSQERENYYEKNIEREGTMVNEWYDSERNDCGLMFIVDDRFVVRMKGDGFSPDEIWGNKSDFKLDEL